MGFLANLGNFIDSAAGQQIAGHLIDAVPGMDDATKAQLSSHLFGALQEHMGASTDDVAAQAGTTPDAATDGSAVTNVIALAQQHPEMLQAAVAAFEQRNPGALMQAPAAMDVLKSFMK